MKNVFRRLPFLLVLAMMTGLLGSCAAGQETSAPTTIPTDISVPFTITVLPEQLNGFSIPGQKIVYLVSYSDQADAGGIGVTITAQAEGASAEVVNKQIGPGQVAEIVVVPDAGQAGKSVSLAISAKRGLVTENKTITFDVIEGQDDRQAYALELQARFIEWLVKNKPELGITADTEWTGTMVSPQWLVVSHYLFFSDEWEMHIEWHIMIAPDDWAKIDLRRRFKESKPSLAFEISSVTAKDDPKPIGVPDTIWR